MPTKQPTPPPKFNIRDQVFYCGRRWKVTDREYKSCGWVYKLEVVEAIPELISEVDTRESNLTLAPKSEQMPKHITQAGPFPPAFVSGDFVLYNTFICEVQSSLYDNKQSKYLYKISTYPGGHVYDFMIQESELKRHNFPSQKSTTVVNEQGGKQSHLDARFDCIPPVVLRLLAQCVGFGARKYGDENWKNIPQQDNLNHAMNHINEWNRGNRDEPHLVNAMARLTFALWQAVDSKDQPDTYLHPDDNQ